MNKGFTLVELSIVLVIIGLLIGGILVAQSLIENANGKKLIRDLEQFKILFYSFKERYRYFPGDVPSSTGYFPASECNTGCYGNGDGEVEGHTEGSSQEGIRAFQHMKLLNMLPSNYQNGLPANFPAWADMDVAIENNYVPNLDYIEKRTILVPYGDISSGGELAFPLPTPSPTCINSFMIGNLNDPVTGNSSSGIIGGSATTNGIPGPWVTFLENKIDDLKPADGQVKAAQVNVSSCIRAAENRYLVGNETANGYAVSEQRCKLLYCIDKR